MGKTATRNVTVVLDDEVARWARLAAAEQDTSVSRFVDTNVFIYRRPAEAGPRQVIPPHAPGPFDIGSLWSALAVLSLALASWVSPAAAAEPSVWPTRGWAESSPGAQGLDAAVLEALDREFAEGKHGYIDGMLVVRNGAVVFEKSYRQDYDRLFVGKGAPALYNYYDPEWHPYWKRGPLHTMQSVSKSVTSILIGIAIRRGEIPGVDARLMPYFRDFRTIPDPRRDSLTLRHVLTMTAGIA